jgi:hypothetical protein
MQEIRMISNLKRSLFAVSVFCLTAMPLVFSEQAEFLDKLSEKSTATFGDCVDCFLYMYSQDASGDFDSKVTLLKKFVPVMPKNISESKELTVGDFSLLTAQRLKIKSGLFYLASRSGRYASRELTFAEILPMNTSEWTKLSGTELIRLLEKAGEYAEKHKID